MTADKSAKSAFFGSKTYSFASVFNKASMSVRMKYDFPPPVPPAIDRKSTRLNSSHVSISYAVFHHPSLHSFPTRRSSDLILIKLVNTSCHIFLFIIDIGHDSR